MEYIVIVHLFELQQFRLPILSFSDSDYTVLAIFPIISAKSHKFMVNYPLAALITLQPCLPLLRASYGVCFGALTCSSCNCNSLAQRLRF